MTNRPEKFLLLIQKLLDHNVWHRFDDSLKAREAYELVYSMGNRPGSDIINVILYREDPDNSNLQLNRCWRGGF